MLVISLVHPGDTITHPVLLIQLYLPSRLTLGLPCVLVQLSFTPNIICTGFFGFASLSFISIPFKYWYLYYNHVIWIK